MTYQHLEIIIIFSLLQIPIELISELYIFLKVNNPSLKIITHFINVLPCITTTLHVNSLLTILDLTDYYLFDKSTAYSIFTFIYIIKSKDNQLESTDSPSTFTSLSSSSSTLTNVKQLLSAQLNYLNIIHTNRN